MSCTEELLPGQARRDGKDEAFAWESREFLRKGFIGKVSDWTNSCEVLFPR